MNQQPEGSVKVAAASIVFHPPESTHHSNKPDHKGILVVILRENLLSSVLLNMKYQLMIYLEFWDFLLRVIQNLQKNAVHTHTHKTLGHIHFAGATPCYDNLYSMVINWTLYKNNKNRDYLI